MVAVFKDVEVICYHQFQSDYLIMEFVARLALLVLLTAVVPETVGMYSGMAAPSKAALLNKVGILKDSLGCSPIKTTEELQTELLGLLKLLECNTGTVPDALAGDLLGLVDKLLQRQVNSADGLVKQLSQLVQPLGCKITQTKDEVVIQLLLNLVQGLCCPKLQPIEALLAAAKLKPPAPPAPKKLPPPPPPLAKLPPPSPPKKLPPPPPCCPDGTVDLNNLVGQVIGAVGGTVDGVFKPVVGLLGDVVSTVGDVVGAMKPAPPPKEGLLPTVGNLVGNVVGAVDGVVDGVLPPVGGLVGNVVGDVGNVVDGVLPPVGNLVGNVLGTVDGTVNGLLQTRNLVGGLGGSVGNILGSVDGVVDGLLPPVGNLVGNVVGGVGGVVDGLLPPVGNLVGNVVDTVDDLLDGGDAPADCNCNNVDVIKPVVTLLGNVVTTVGTVVDTLNGGVVKPVAGLVETVGQALPCAICNPKPPKADLLLLPPPPPPAPPKPALDLNNLYLDLKDRVDILELYQPAPEPPKCPLCQINLKQESCPNCDLLPSACEYSSTIFSLEPFSESTNIKALVLPPSPSKGPANLLQEAIKKLICRPAKPVPVLLQSVLKIARSLNCPTLTTIQEQVSTLLELLEVLANNPPSSLGELRSVLRNLLQVFGCAPKVPIDVLINDLISLIMDLSCQKLAPIENLLAGPTSVQIKFCPISGKLVTQPPPPPPQPSCAKNPDSLLLDAISKLGCRPAKPVAALKQSVLKIATSLNCPTLTSTNEQIGAILELLEILANNPPRSLGELRSVLRNYLQVFGCSPLLPVDVLINELVGLIMDLSCQKLAPVEDLLIEPTAVEVSPCSASGQFLLPPPPPPAKKPQILILEAANKLGCKPAKPIPVLLQAILKIGRSLNCPKFSTTNEQVTIVLELLDVLANNPPRSLDELQAALLNFLQTFGCSPLLSVDALINELVGLIMDLSCRKLAPVENLINGNAPPCPYSGKIALPPPEKKPVSLLLDAVKKLSCKPAKPLPVLLQGILKIAKSLNCPTITTTQEQVSTLLELLESLANNPPSSFGELRSVLPNLLQVLGCAPKVPVDVLINDLIGLIMDLSCQKLAPIEDLLIGPTAVQDSPCSASGQFLLPPPPPAAAKNPLILILEAVNKLGCKPAKPIPVLLQAILKIGRSLNCPNFSTTNEQVTIVLELLEVLANNPPRSLDELQAALLNFLQTFGCSPLLSVDALINELVGLIMDLSCRKLAPVENLINGNAPPCPYSSKIALPPPAKNPVSLLLDAVKKLSCKPAKPLPVLLQAILKIAKSLNCPTLTTTGEQVATILELLEILAYNPPDSLSELQSTLLNFIQVFGCSPLLPADALVNEIIELILDLSCQKLAPLENLVAPCPFSGRTPSPPPTEKNLVVLLLEAVKKLGCLPSKPLPVLLQNILKIAQSLNCPNLTTSEKVKSILGLLEMLADNPPRTYSELKVLLLNFLKAFDCTSLLPPDALVNELLGLIVDLSCKKLEPLVGLLAGGVVSCPYSGITPIPPPEKNPTTLLISAINKLACRPAKPVPVLLKSILKIARNLNCPSLTTPDEQACALIELLELLASNPPSSLGELRSILNNFLQLFGCSALLPKDVIINELLGLISDLCCQKLAPIENLLAGSPSPQDFIFDTINANSYSTVIDLFSQELISLTKDLQCSPSKSPTDLAEELHALLSNLVCDSCSDVDDLYFEVLKLIRLLSRGGVQSPEDFAHIFNNVLQKYKCKTSEPVELLVEKLLGFIRNLYCKRLNWVSPILKGLMPIGKLLGHSLT